MAQTTALAPWFGSARLIAKHIGEKLEGCKWVGVPFAGGMTELLYINARTLIVSDLHGLIINLAQVVGNKELYPILRDKLKYTAFHPKQLALSQVYCRNWSKTNAIQSDPDVIVAYHFFVCAWMGRNRQAGTPREFSGGVSIRWDAAGGDSCTRFRSASRALVGWRRVFERCTFQILDAFKFLDKCKDQELHGIYCDPPFPGPGDGYSHQFNDEQHRKLADRLRQFNKTRVVCRFYDIPFIRELYSDKYWTYYPLTGRDQANQEKSEILIVNILNNL